MNANLGENINTDEIFQKHLMYIDGMCNHASKKDLGDVKVEKNYSNFNKTITSGTVIKIRLNMNSKFIYFDVDD